MSCSINLNRDSSNNNIELAQQVACQKIEDIIVNQQRKYCSTGYEEVEAFCLELLSSGMTASGGYGINIASWLDITHIIEGKIVNSYEDKINWKITLDNNFLVMEVEKLVSNI